MSIFALPPALSTAFSALTHIHWRGHHELDMSAEPTVGRPPFASKLEFDEYMLRDIGLGDGGYHEWQDDRLN